MTDRPHSIERLLTFLLMTMAVGCGGAGDSGSGEAQNARQAVQEMSALAQGGDWGAYVDRFYGEAHKFRDETDRQELVRRFEGGWGERVQPALQRAAELTPTIEGDRAIFREGEEVVFELYRDDAGRWGFHL